MTAADHCRKEGWKTGDVLSPRNDPHVAFLLTAIGQDAVLATAYSLKFLPDVLCAGEQQLDPDEMWTLDKASPGGNP